MGRGGICTAVIHLCLGALLLCVHVKAEMTLHTILGESVQIPSPLISLQKQNISSIQWRFQQTRVAELSEGNLKTNMSKRFVGRLLMDSVTGSLTVKKLQLQDTGMFSPVILTSAGHQMPAQVIHLQVHEPIGSVQIQSEISWVQGNSTCQVYLLCSSTGDRSASYRWEGQQEGSGTHLHFSLSPVEGDIKLTCTAANPATNSSREVTLTCRPTAIEGPAFWSLDLVLFVGIPVAGVLLFALVVGLTVFCWKKRKAQKVEEPREEMTLYSVVSRASKRKKTEPQMDPTSVYETVQDACRAEAVPSVSIYDTVQSKYCVRKPVSPLHPETVYDTARKNR